MGDTVKELLWDFALLALIVLVAALAATNDKKLDARIDALHSPVVDTTGEGQ